MDEQWACIVGLPEKLEPGALGFAVRFADSSTGQVQEAYFYAEQFHSFSGRKGNDRASAWVMGRPYLLAVTPCLPLGVQKAPWFARTTITLEYGIFREPIAHAGRADGKSHEREARRSGKSRQREAAGRADGRLSYRKRQLLRPLRFAERVEIRRRSGARGGGENPRRG